MIWVGLPTQLRGAATLGTAGGATIVVGGDPTVSSRHAELTVDRGGAVVRDLGSTNGTFVNNQRLAAPRRLADGDVLRLGGATQFKVRMD